MAETESDESKPHEPTPKKLEEARKKGDIPRSADVTAAVAYAGFFAALALAGASIAGGIGNLGTTLIARPDRLAPLFFDGPSAAPTAGLLRQMAGALAPLFAIPIALVVAVLIAQRGIVFSAEKLKPKISRISIVSNLKQKFGANGLVEFVKSFTKLLAYSTALGVFLSSKVETLALASTLEPRPAALLIGRLAVEFLGMIVVIAAVVGALDLLWQQAEHRRRNRMSHKELRDEVKEAEGDPHLKASRRQRGVAIAQNAMLADVPNASVVVVNPTHYAVALQWTRGQLGAPVCLAKGTDEIAARIREIAEEAGVPIHSDPPTARALFATVEIGAEIERTHYGPVAAAIRFAESARAKASQSLL